MTVGCLFGRGMCLPVFETNLPAAALAVLPRSTGAEQQSNIAAVEENEATAAPQHTVSSTR